MFNTLKLLFNLLHVTINISMYFLLEYTLQQFLRVTKVTAIWFIANSRKMQENPLCDDDDNQRHKSENKNYSLSIFTLPVKVLRFHQYCTCTRHTENTLSRIDWFFSLLLESARKMHISTSAFCFCRGANSVVAIKTWFNFNNTIRARSKKIKIIKINVSVKQLN